MCRRPTPGRKELKPLDLIATARDLTSRADGGKPRQSDLRRAQSTAYYAVFHTLAQLCANLLVGGSAAERSRPAWVQVYRALEHGNVKDACKNRAIISRFPKNIEDFANAFVTLQTKRHQADYDPFENFVPSSVGADINVAEEAIKKLLSENKKDKKAFAVYILLRRQKNS